jgi:hypothetical protein
MQVVDLPDSLALLKAGNIKPANTAIIAITVSISMIVKDFL